MPATLVRPIWQGEPANIPDAGIAWVAFGIHSRTPDTYIADLHHNPSPNPGTSTLIRHEGLLLRCMFYDLGVNGQADALAGLLVDQLQIGQNREVLQLAGYAVVDSGPPTPAPVLFKMRWQYRVDVEVRMRRMVQRIYPIETIIQAEGTILFDGGEPPVPWITQTIAA